MLTNTALRVVKFFVVKMLPIMHRKSSLPATKMAELSAKKLPRDRKANFTSIEANLISSRVTHELELLKGGFSPEVTNQKKNELWKVITEEVNALGVCMRSETEVRNKYRNMCRGAKEKFTNNRKEMSKTGGGPPPTQLTIAEENIVNAMRDSASFIGVDGLETEITCNEAISTTNGSQSPCTATDTPRPTAEASVWMRALDRHHANLQNNEQTCPVADDAEGTDRNATSPGPSISASSQSKRSSSSCSIQQTPIKKKKTAEDVYTLQCAVLEKELEKNTLQVDLLRKLLSKYDSLDSDALELLSVLGQ
ncbi:Hypothetical predicted protein [Mytilus galloprovincialis]|uniref:Myb/SANT-like DNA-binding domain-containing protein n=2 Tax=Mytilus galloprovincialis TaxID=29158 RepID=A0A8B6D4V1_MYTGA|nr:Hypothetical predicted protein [Mytilus galloprovincialis]